MPTAGAAEEPRAAATVRLPVSRSALAEHAPAPGQSVQGSTLVPATDGAQGPADAPTGGRREPGSTPEDTPMGDRPEPGPTPVNDERFMREALAEARAAAAEGEVPIGAVVVYEGQIIARAHNRREQDENPSAHAEFSAMLAAARALGCWRLTGCTVYVTLEPCAMCAGLMVNARVSRCVYGAADPKGGALGTLYQLNDDSRLNHAFSVTAGVLEDECAEVLQSFFAELRAARRSEAQPKEACTQCAGRAEAAGGAGAENSQAKGEGDAREAAGCAQQGGKPRVALTGIRAPRVLVAIDSFKGSATSGQAERWVAEGIRHAAPEAQVSCIPVADGGEGTVEAVRAACGGTLRELEVTGPFGRTVRAHYLQGESEPADGDATGAWAVIEMAEAAGIGYSPCTAQAALAASTRGVGELVRDAVAQGTRRIYLGLGGSATSDGGAGFLQALGARVADAAGDDVAPGLFGLSDVVRIDLAPALRTLAGVELVVLADVRNPLVGPRGAVRVFGPQKGLAELDEEELAEADGWMAAYAARLTEARDALDGTDMQVGAPGKRPRSLAGVPGAGAAGGLAAAALALGARLSLGVDAVLDLAGFDAAVRTADLVITGEGTLDAQTAEGKAPVGIARRAKAVNPRVPVIAVCGGRTDDLDAVYQAGIDLVLPIVRRPMPLEQALSPEETRANLRTAGEAALRAYLLRAGR